MKTLGEKIAQLRREKKLTQQEFADRMSVSRQAVSNWERDKNEPDVSALKQIGKLFGVDMNELLDDVQHPVKPMDTRRLTVLYAAVLAVNLIYFLSLVQKTSSWTAAFGRYGFRFVFVLIATSIYFALSFCLRSHDYSLLSGYDPHAPYDQEVLGEMTAALAMMILLDTLGFSILTGVLESWISSDLSLLLFIAYLFCLGLAIITVNLKYRNRLYRDPQYPQKVRGGIGITVFFLTAVILAAAILIIGGVSGSVKHNSPQAAFQVIILLPYLLINIIWLMIEQDKLHRDIEQGKSYRFGGNTLMLAAADGILLVLMGLIGWG